MRGPESGEVFLVAFLAMEFGMVLFGERFRRFVIQLPERSLINLVISATIVGFLFGLDWGIPAFNPFDKVQ